MTFMPSLAASVALPPISESVLALTMVSMPLTATPALPEAAMVSTAAAKCQAMKASPASSPKTSVQVPFLPRAADSFSGMGAKKASFATAL